MVYLIVGLMYVGVTGIISFIVKDLDLFLILNGVAGFISWMISYRFTAGRSEDIVFTERREEIHSRFKTSQKYFLFGLPCIGSLLIYFL